MLQMPPVEVNLREIPNEYQPLVQQWLLNLAIHGELKDEDAALEALRRADEINKKFDEFLITVAGD